MYLRQSLDRLGDELGVTRQREDCSKLAELRGWTVVAEHTDNDTSAAGTRIRPGFEAVIQAVETGQARCIVAWDMSRLTRNARDRLRLLEAGKRHSVTVAFVRGSDLDLGTPAGRLTADILGSVALHEIEQKSDRQRRSAQQAAEQGRRVGGRRPFGYEPDGMTIREDEAVAVVAAYDSILSGVPLGAIARDWNARGLLTPQKTRGGDPSEWTSQTLGPVLQNPRYAGLRSHVTEAVRVANPDPRAARIAGIVGPAQWPALVTEETWRAAVEVLRDPTRAHLGRAGRGLLTGVALCGACAASTPPVEATVHKGAAPGRGGRPGHGTYRCSANLGHMNRQSRPVDEYVSEIVIARLSRPDAARLLTDDKRPDAAKLRREAAALRSRLDGLSGLYADGTVTAAGVRRDSAKLKAKLAAVEREQADAGRVNILGPLIGTDDVRAEWEAFTVDHRRAVIGTLMTITLLAPGRGTRTFRPETVVIEWDA